MVTMSRKEIFISCVGILLLSLLLTACHTTTYSQATAKTRLILADVTSGGGSGKGSTSYKSESYWYDPNAVNSTIIRCYHSQDDWINLIGNPDNCEKFQIPPQLPRDASLLGINLGQSQVTQSVWLLNDGKMTICDHDGKAWYDNATGSVNSCKPFIPPAQLANSVLISLNSGKGIVAESFWSNPDGSISECQHDKQGTGFLGWGPQAFGQVTRVVQI